MYFLQNIQVLFILFICWKFCYEYLLNMFILDFEKIDVIFYKCLVFYLSLKFISTNKIICQNIRILRLNLESSYVTTT